MNVSAQQWLQGYPLPSSVQDVLVDGLYVHVSPIVDTVGGCVSGTSRGCMKGDVLTLRGANFASAPALTSAQLVVPAPVPSTVYSTNFTVVNDTTLLMPIPQTSESDSFT